MFLLVVGYNLYFAPEEDPTASVAQTEVTNVGSADTATQTPVATPSAVPDSLAELLAVRERENKLGIFAAAGVPRAEQEYILSNKLVDIRISNKGGTFRSVRLTDGYTTFWEKKPISLFRPEETRLNLSFDYTGKERINTAELFFVKAGEKSTADGKELIMRLDGGNNRYIDIVYFLANDSYEVKTEIRTVGMSDPVNLSTARLDWEMTGLHNEKGIEWERQHSAVYFREMGQGRDYLGDGQDDEDTVEESLHWVAFKQNFFSAAVINDEGFGGNSYLHSAPPADAADTSVTMNYVAKLPVNLDVTGTETLRFYFGPNDLAVMNKLEVEEFSRIIDYGWWIFGWINRWVVRPVFNWLASSIGSIGITIVVITLLIKLLLSPITWKNFLSSAKMRVLKPEMDAINEKYKDEPMEKQKAQMDLYRQTGVNPFAGCLPMLLQMPILYAMFRFFPANIDLRGKSFLWADDLGAYDAIFTWSQHIPVISTYYGNHISGFTLMMAVSTYVYSNMSMANMPTTQQPGMPNMKVIMNIFPIFTLVFFNKFAAGLSFYYFCANVLSIAQMVIIKRYFINEDKIRMQIETNKTT
ncbi:MAG: hypothetical protein RL226_523, partial [Bacteroidota bacterium]